MSLIERVTRDGITPETAPCDPARVLAGNPIHTTWAVETRGNIHSGLWQSTPGKWNTRYTEWEYVHILQGHSILTDTDGVETHLRAGDSFVIRPGFQGTWEVVETTLKDYVIVE